MNVGGQICFLHKFYLGGFFSRCTKLELLCKGHSIPSVFEECLYCFPKKLDHLIIPPAVNEGPIFSTFMLILVVLFFVMCASLTHGVK